MDALFFHGLDIGSLLGWYWWSMFSEVGEKEKGEEEGTKTKLLAGQPSKPDTPNQLEKRYLYFKAPSRVVPLNRPLLGHQRLYVLNFVLFKFCIFCWTSVVHSLKGTVWSDWICMRMVPLDRPWKGHQPLQVFFYLEYLIRVQSSEPLHAKMNPTSCLSGSRFSCAQTSTFTTKPCSKNVGDTSIVLWIMARE